MANLLVWADIPVTDMARARAFYAKLLGNEIQELPGMSEVALLMPLGTGEASDSSADLALNGMTQPSSTHGPIIYLSAGGDIDAMLERAVEAGGTIKREKQDMGQYGGWLAFIIDTEGNLIGISQPSAPPTPERGLV